MIGAMTLTSWARLADAPQGCGGVSGGLLAYQATRRYGHVTADVVDNTPVCSTT
jgi:hypothetical protein